MSAKYLLIALILLNGKVFGHEPTFIGLPQDKILHLTVSEMGTSFLIKVGQGINESHRITRANRIFSSSIMVSIGYLKERKDMLETGRSFDYPDFAADVMGVIIGNLLQIEF